MDKEEKKIFSQFYYPFCRVDTCDGVLKIRINKNNFSLDYECDKNKEHKGTNIYYKTFERFYLKQINPNKCKKCGSLLENYIKYECKSCQKYFCPSCFLSHKHFKQNINNILIKSLKCNIHNANNMHYCITCKKYLCNYCLKDEINIHQRHLKKNLYELMPSKNRIKNFENRLKEYDDLIQNIDFWVKEFNQKIIRLKQNIIAEKELFKKLTLNFNQSFINYSYFSNFYHLSKYSKNFNNEYLDQFSKSFSFEDKGKILLEYFSQEQKIQHIDDTQIEINDDNHLKFCSSLNNGIFCKITDNYFFKYSYKDKEVEIVKYNKRNETFSELKETKETFVSKICSVSIIDNLDNNYTIYACLLSMRKIIIFNFDLNSRILRREDDKIIKFGLGNFKKVIQLSNELIATADSSNVIDIWTKDKESDIGFSNIGNIALEEDITDILSVNSDYFISSQSIDEKIYFFDIKSLSKEKTLFNVDCLDKPNSLLVFNNQYIIVNCFKGFSLISIKTKEVIQYIEDYFNKYTKKEFFLNSNQYIYIMYVEDSYQGGSSSESDDSDDSDDAKKNINLITLKFMEFSFQIVEKFEDIEAKGDLNLICINDQNIMFWGKNLYLLK